MFSLCDGAELPFGSVTPVSVMAAQAAIHDNEHLAMSHGKNREAEYPMPSTACTEQRRLVVDGRLRGHDDNSPMSDPGGSDIGSYWLTTVRSVAIGQP